MCCYFLLLKNKFDLISCNSLENLTAKRTLTDQTLWWALVPDFSCARSKGRVTVLSLGSLAVVVTGSTPWHTDLLFLSAMGNQTPNHTLMLNDKSSAQVDLNRLPVWQIEWQIFYCKSQITQIKSPRFPQCIFILSLWLIGCCLYGATIWRRHLFCKCCFFQLIPSILLNGS